MSCAHFKGAAHPVEVRLLLREGVAILPCNRGFESVIYIGNGNERIHLSTMFLKYLKSEQIDLNIDEFSEASHSIFKKQENDYLSGEGFRVFSMLTLAFLQLGILEI